jgi:photosystem II stability/assembly factor-like uncharacterized protein
MRLTAINRLTYDATIIQERSMNGESLRGGALAAAVVAGLCCFGHVSAFADEFRAKSQIVEDLYDAAFVSQTQGWAVGAFGSVYSTTDGGQHWTLANTPTTQHLYGVSFADAKNGWAVGRSGEIIHTQDGGATWTEQKGPSTKHLFKVEFTSATEGWAVGDWGLLIHTSDAGATWEDRSIPEDKILYAIDFADAQNGWIVGEFGTILKTADGGQTWTKQTVATQKTFFGVAAASPEQAWTVGIDGLVARTKDGGATWDLQRGQPEPASFESLGFAEMLKNPGLYDIKIRGTTGYVVGDTGNVLVSEDGGETWTQQQLPSSWRLSWIRGLALLPSGESMLVGAQGLTFVAKGKEMRFSQAPM